VQKLSEHSKELSSLENVRCDEFGKSTLDEYLEDPEALSPLECATEAFDRNRVCEAVRQAVTQLPERQAEIVSLRFGLDGGKGLTLEAIAQRMSLTRERVRQLERAACKQLRGAESLRCLLEDEV
jgi:RNA polymerase sigma factor (sigma-70 family)